MIFGFFLKYFISVNRIIHTSEVCPSFRSKVGFIGPRKHAGRKLLYMKSTKPAKPLGPPERNKRLIVSYTVYLMMTVGI